MNKLLSLALAALLLLGTLTSCLSFASPSEPPVDEPKDPSPAPDAGEDEAPTDEPDTGSSGKIPTTEPSTEPEAPAEDEPSAPAEPEEPAEVEEIETPGLVYVLNADGASYTVKAGKEFDSAELIIPSRHNGKPVTEIADQGFFQKKQITRVVLPDTIERIGWAAFYYCNALTEINFPASLVEIGESAFFNCTKLTALSFGDKLETIGRAAFSRCYELTEVSLPDSVRSIGDTAFGSCVKLTKLTLPSHGLDLDYDLVIATPLEEDASLWENGILYLNGHLLAVSDEISGALTIKSGTLSIAGSAFAKQEKLTSVVIPDSVEVIGDSAFQECTSLRSATFGRGLSSIGAGAFACCYGLTEINLPDTLLTISDSAFQGCKALSSVTIPLGVTTIETEAFRSCEALTRIIIPKSVTYIGMEAFCGCESLNSITLPDELTHIGKNAFSNTAYTNNRANYENGLMYIGNHLVAAYKPNSVCTVKPGTLAIAEVALWNEDSLVEIILPDSVTTVGTYAIYRCFNLQRLTIGANAHIETMGISYCPKLTDVTVKNPAYEFKGGCLIDKASKTVIFATANATIPTDGSVTVIGENALFRSEATSIVIPEGVVCLEATALGECTSLTDLSLPASLAHIGDKALAGCTALSYITYGGTVAQWGEITSATHLTYEIRCADGTIPASTNE